MAKSPSDQIRELLREVIILREHDATRERDLNRLEVKLDAECEARHRLEVELADVKRLLQEQIKKADQTDARRWAVIALVISALFSLASGLIVSLTRK